MAVILVDRPTVDDDRVFFSWTSSKPLQQVRASRFYVQYVGLPVSGLPEWIHLNTLVGLLLARLSEIPERHLVVLDTPVPRWVIDLWGSYHAADNVLILAEDAPTAAPLAAPVARPDQPHFGVLFGGGKDSLLATDLLREAFPEAKISLLSYSIPASHNKLENLELRRTTHAVSGAAQRYGAAVVAVRTDVNAVFEPFFHTELYTATMLPVLCLTDLSAVTFSYEYCHYWTRYAQGQRHLFFRKSRPEHCAAISRAYSTALGRKFDLFNANGFITELASFLYLSRKRPSFANEVMMCESTEDPDTKWCNSCTKCAEYALFSAAAGITDGELPLSDFLVNSRWITKVLPEVEQRLGQFPGELDQPKRWFPAMINALHFDSFSHVVGKLAADPPADLNDVARHNLRLLADAYARDGLDAEEVAYERVLERTWPPEFHSRVLPVVRRHVATALSGPEVKLWGSSAVVFDDSVVDDIPERHRVGFGPDAFAGEIVSMGTRLCDWNLVRPGDLGALQVRPRGATGADQLMIARGVTWMDVHSTVGDPGSGDGFRVCGHLPPPEGLPDAELSIRVSSPYFNPGVTGWLGLRMSIDGECLLEADLAEFGGSFFVTAPSHGRAVELSIDVVALRDCQNWGWGKAMRLCVEHCGWQATKAKEPPKARLTYPRLPSINQ